MSHWPEYNPGSRYPQVQANRMSFARLQRWVRWFFIVSFLVCAVVNIAVGGIPWVAFVLVSEIICYRLFFSREVIENTVPQQVMTLIYLVCILLIVIEWSGAADTHMMEIAVPMTYFGALVFNAVIYFVGFRHQRRNVLPLLQMTGAALLILPFTFFAPIRVNWARITLLSVSAGIVMIAAVFFRNPILVELKKIFHLS